MNKNKVLAICLSTILSLSLLSGCGKEKDSDESTTSGNKKDVKITMLLADAGTAPYSKDWKVLNWIKEKAGVTLDIQAVPSSDYNQKVTMAFNSGNTPDLIGQFSPNANLALSGQVLPVNKYMDKLPNFKKFLKDNNFEDMWDNTKFSDGNNYFIPLKAHDINYQSRQWIIRADIFKKNNIPVPKTLDEVLEAGKKLKQLYPDSNPITNRFGSNNIMGGLAAGYGTIAGWNYGDGTYYNTSKKSYEFAPISDGWKDMVTIANKMYSTGVLDKEYSTIDSVVYEQKVTQGKTFILYDWGEYINKYESQGKEVDPDYDLQIIYPPTGYDKTFALPRSNPWTQSLTIPASLADDEKHLDDVLEYIDWGYSEEAKVLLTFGKEGDSFEVKDGMKKYIGDKDYKKDYGLAINSLVFREDMDFFYSNFSKEDKDMVNKICKECIKPSLRNSPLSEKDMDSIQVYQTSLKDYCVSMMEKFVNGSEPLSNWDEFVKQCHTKGCDKLVDTYNTALKNLNK